MKNVLLCALLCCLPALAFAQDMTLGKMSRILKKNTTELEGKDGFWTAVFEDQVLFIVTDESANRMRIFTPIVERRHLSETELTRMLEANFHSALDAKYALYEEYVVSVFTHPLRELTEAQFLDAMVQVARLSVNFGTTYHSTDFIFGENRPPADPPRTKPGVKRS